MSAVQDSRSAKKLPRKARSLKGKKRKVAQQVARGSEALEVQATKARRRVAGHSSYWAIQLKHDLRGGSHAAAPPSRPQLQLQVGLRGMAAAAAPATNRDLQVEQVVSAGGAPQPEAAHDGTMPVAQAGVQVTTVVEQGVLLWSGHRAAVSARCILKYHDTFADIDMMPIAARDPDRENADEADTKEEDGDDDDDEGAIDDAEVQLEEDKNEQIEKDSFLYSELLKVLLAEEESEDFDTDTITKIALSSVRADSLAPRTIAGYATTMTQVVSMALKNQLRLASESAWVRIMCYFAGASDPAIAATAMALLGPGDANGKKLVRSHMVGPYPILLWASQYRVRCALVLSYQCVCLLCDR